MTRVVSPVATSPVEPGTRTNRVFLFAIGAASAFYIPVGGQFYLSEIVAVLATPFVLLHAHRVRGLHARWVYVTGVLCAFGYALGAYANGAALSMVTSSVVSVLVLVITVAALTLWATKRDSLNQVVFGLAIGGAAAAIIQPVYYYAEAPWKFGLGLPLTILIVWLASWARARLVRLLVLLFAAGLNLALDYRSLALILGVVMLLDALGAVASARKISRSTILGIGLGGTILIGTVVAAVYQSAAASGALGASAKLRLELQGGGSPLTMLLGGRNEIFFSLPAALERPFLGYGPVPEVSSALMQSAFNNLRNLGLTQVAEGNVGREVIPTHSILMSAWIGAGLLGLVFWVAVLLLLVRGAAAAVALAASRALPLFLILLAIWNVIFSPFGGNTRFLMAVTIAYALVLTRQPREETVGHIGRVEDRASQYS